MYCRFLILLCVATFSSSCELFTDNFNPEDIQIAEVMYARVNNSNPASVWSEEFGIESNLLSTLLNSKMGEKELMARIYLPPKKLFFKRPAVLVFHGGAFLPGMGSKDDAHIHTTCLKLSQRGMVAIAVEYRLVNILTPSFIKAGYVATQDAKAALRYFANHNEQYQINKRKLYLIGYSAGAIVALQGAFLDTGEPILNRAKKLDKMYGHINSLGEDEIIPFAVAGVVNISGGIYDINILDGNPNIKTLNVHSEDDEIIPFDSGVPFRTQSRIFDKFLGFTGSLFARFPRIKRKIEEAKMFEIYGSNRIHTRMKKNYGEKASQLIAINGNYHTFMFSQNGLLTSQGEEVFQRIIQFIR